MNKDPRHPTHHVESARRPLFARIVTCKGAPPCSIEAALCEQGAQVTRLLAAELLPQEAERRRTFQLLGRLYEGIILPHTPAFDAFEVATVAGVPVAFEDQQPSALLPGTQPS